MTYGVVVSVPAPFASYEATHAEVMATVGDTPVPGLLVHFGRPTADGFQIVEVWRSKADSDRFNGEVVNPIVERLAAGLPEPPAEPVVEEFEVHGLVVGPAG